MEALEAKKPVDYAPTLAALMQELERLTAASASIAQTPALRVTPDKIIAEVRRAADNAVKPAVAEVQRVQALSAMFERSLGGVRARKEQARWILWAVAGGVAAGAGLTLAAIKMLGG